MRRKDSRVEAHLLVHHPQAPLNPQRDKEAGTRNVPNAKPRHRAEVTHKKNPTNPPNWFNSTYSNVSEACSRNNKTVH